MRITLHDRDVIRAQEQEQSTQKHPRKERIQAEHKHVVEGDSRGMQGDSNKDANVPGTVLKGGRRIYITRNGSISCKLSTKEQKRRKKTKVNDLVRQVTPARPAGLPRSPPTTQGPSAKSKGQGSPRKKSPKKSEVGPEEVHGKRTKSRTLSVAPDCENRNRKLEKSNSIAQSDE
jgi:hypothetical protein